MKRFLFVVLAGACLAAGCRKIELVNPTEYEVPPFGEDPDADPIGMYLLNEGNMGSNKADLDYLDYRTAVYARGVYAEKNPGVVRGLGANDHPNCRYIRFKGKYAYVSAYVGPVAMDPDARKGAVFKVDLDTYEIVGEVTVGYQPDELAIVGNRAYVANSGGYRDHNPSNLYRLEPDGGRYRVAEAMNIPASNMAVSGDSLYVYSVEYSNQTSKNTVTYAFVDVRKKRVVSRKFITDGTELDIVIPYGIAIHPRNGDIYVTDAKNYVSSGVLHCYSREGVRKWSVRTGDIPAHMAFLERKQTRR